MYLTAKLTPSYKTISEIRRENLKVSIDSTKIRANAYGKLSKDETGLEKLIANVKQNVASILEKAKTIDKQEDS